MAKKKAESKERKETVPLGLDPKVVEESVQAVAETGKMVVDEFMKISEDVQSLGVEIATIASTTGLKQNEALIGSIRKTAEELLKITSATSTETLGITGNEVKDLSQKLESIAGSATELMSASSDVVRSTANLGVNLFRNSLLMLREVENLVGGVVFIGGSTLGSLGEFLESLGKLGKTTGKTIESLGKSLQK